MDTFKILVTGSRDWTDQAMVRKALREAINLFPAPGEIRLLHGACPTGADQAAERAWLDLGGTTSTIDRFPPDRTFGKRGFYLRNKAMVDLKPAVCLAFVGVCSRAGCSRAPQPHPSHGTQMTIDLCRAAGVPVRQFLPDGTL